MPLKIEDGKGKGTVAGVTVDNALQTFATSISYVGRKAIDGQTISVDMTSLNVPASEHILLYVANEGRETLVIDHIIIGFDGGDTNFNRAAKTNLYLNPDAPTEASRNSARISNTNLQLDSDLGLVAYEWDGATAGGLDITTTGTQDHTTYAKQGMNRIDFHQSYVLPRGNSMAVAVTPGEQGDVGITMIVARAENL